MKHVLCKPTYSNGDVCFSLNDATMAVVHLEAGQPKFMELPLQTVKDNPSVFGNYESTIRVL
jgi:hypothetical protein